MHSVIAPLLSLGPIRVAHELVLLTKAPFYPARKNLGKPLFIEIAETCRRCQARTRADEDRLGALEQTNDTVYCCLAYFRHENVSIAD